MVHNGAACTGRPVFFVGGYVGPIIPLLLFPSLFLRKKTGFSSFPYHSLLQGRGKPAGDFR